MSYLLPVQESTDDMIVGEFGEADLAALPWKLALRAISYEYGLTDDTGRAVNAWARRMIVNGRKVHGKARREQLEDERRWRRFAVPDARSSLEKAGHVAAVNSDTSLTTLPIKEATWLTTE